MRCVIDLVSKYRNAHLNRLYVYILWRLVQRQFLLPLARQCCICDVFTQYIKLYYRNTLQPRTEQFFSQTLSEYSPTFLLLYRLIIKM